MVLLRNFLIDVYYNGTNTAYRNHQLEYLKNLIYWITLQEEINYPHSKGYAGRNLAFCRFFEAIYATQSECNFTVQEVQNRCNNHGRNKPNLYDLPTSPTFYNY